MKLQGMSIVFALVIVPLILVLSYYIGLQVDTIELQTEYDSKLLDSTYDAMAAFELNTANEDLSTVSDSLRTIIEASYNVFINNLATNLGMSNANKSYVEPFIPAVLFTLYDGYYICAPTKVPTVLTDSNGNAVSVGDKGVSGASGNYQYDEDAETYLSGDVGQDYGQLLYLKDSGTNTYTADINQAKLETKNVLKTYMPYSARYVGTNYDLTMIYTLDNYVTVEGNIGNVYYTKSGYLIPTNNVTINISELNDTSYSTQIIAYSQKNIQELIENRQAKIEVVINDGTNTTITLNKGNSKASLETKMNVLKNALEDAQESWYSMWNAENKSVISGSNVNDAAVIATREKYRDENFFINLRDTYGVTGIDINWANRFAATETSTNPAKDMEIILDEFIDVLEKEITNTQYELDLISSVVYYSKAYIFSSWVKDYLCDASKGCNVIEDDLVEVSGQVYTTMKGIESLEFDFNTGSQIFNFNGTEPVSVTEIPTDSPFYQHKLDVIKMSIQYNLNLAMSTYNNDESYLFEYEMPVIQSSEWERILTNISITSFMQGVKCGLKTYNNYKIVSSTNNDIMVLPEDIYYVKKENFNDESSEYHKINCDKILKNDSADSEYIAFSSKEVKYDKIYNKTRSYMLYEYDHKNYACYDCINDGNYFNYDTTGDGHADAQVNIFDTTDTAHASYSNLRKAYYIGVAKERNDTYKMNAVINSQGYEILKYSKADSARGSSLGIDRIESIEIAIGTIYSQNASIRSVLYTFDYGGATNLSNDNYSVATNNSSNNSTQSLKISVVPGKLTGTGNFSIGNLKPVCQDSEGNSFENEVINPNNGENAVEQFKNAIKYIRVIYK